MILAGLAVLSGCSVQMPNEMPAFLGREGTGEGNFALRGEPPPEPRAVPLREVALERGLHGVILRAAGEAPSWGYYSAALRPLGNGAPDAAGVLSFELVATPPRPSEPVGAARSRQLTAAIFVPTITANKLKGFRVSGVGEARTLPLR